MTAAEGDKLVLVADDDADVRELVEFRLAHAGYEVITAADGEEAVELALARRPRLCVIDVMMPKLDGYQVTERLRAAQELADVRVVLLTASVEEASVERGFEVGADDYITKPFSPRELLERVASVLG
jgi:two-component system response regulator MtrA